MASTPKIVRRTAKRVRREVSNYLGFPVRARVNLGADTSSITQKKSGRTRSQITIDAEELKSGKITSAGLRRRLHHEFFHVGHDTFILGRAALVVNSVSEAMAVLGTAEEILRASRNPNAYQHYLSFQRDVQLNNPPEKQIHRIGFKIMLNILEKYPSPIARKQFVRELLKKNAATLRAKQTNSDLVGVNGYGEIFLVPNEVLELLHK
jgi:hypothetical protein